MEIERGVQFCRREHSFVVDIVLVEPEIPHNTGAIARTCAATGARLHLIRPLGFDISDKMVRRCGLDYWYLVDILVYDNLDAYFEANGDEGLFLATTKAPYVYMPEWLREKYRDRCIRIPMVSEARSLNLSNSVAIIAYEALRQQGFEGLKSLGSMADKQV